MPLEKIAEGRFPIRPAKEKHLYLSIFLAIITGMLVGSIVLLPLYNTLSYGLIKALQLLIFIVFGSWLISLEKNFLKPANNQVLFIAITLCFLLSTLYIFLRKDIWLMAFSSSAAFALPFYVRLSWQHFTSIPSKQFNTWFPYEERLTGKTVVSLNSLVVRLKILQHVSDVDEKVYTVFIPNDNRLGDFFSRFLAEHNTHTLSYIEDHDTYKNKYAWEFYESTFFGFGSRKIDPYLTMIENKIKKDAVVYIKRIIRQTAAPVNKKIMVNETVK